MLKNAFRLIGYLEAGSFIYLLGVAMPAKYLEGNLHATQIPGALHGAFFMAYLFLAYNLAEKEQWDARLKWFAVLASIFPFGTIVFDLKFHRYK